MMIGGDISYPTKKGDCLLLVGAKVGVDWALARIVRRKC
jgi:hypothetical protein